MKRRKILGTLQMLVLSRLNHKPASGMDLQRVLAKNGFEQLPQAIYLTLERLRGQGLVSRRRRAKITRRGGRSGYVYCARPAGVESMLVTAAFLRTISVRHGKK